MYGRVLLMLEGTIVADVADVADVVTAKSAEKKERKESFVAADADDLYTVQELWTKGRAAPGSWCLWQRPGSWSPTTSYPFRSSIYYSMLFLVHKS